MKPLLKWVGGKTQIIDDILNLIPENLDNYYEPFAGGGSVFLAILSSPNIKIKGEFHVSDKNPYLINFYKCIQSRTESFVVAISTLTDTYLQTPTNGELNKNATTIEEASSSQESFYYWIRRKFNSLIKMYDVTTINEELAVYFIFLNKTSFRGVYREGPNGFNVPFGNYKTPSIYNIDEIRLCARLIKRVQFHTCEFTKIFELLKSGDFLYLDPPYAPENTKSFVGYTSDGFKLADHRILFDSCNTFLDKEIGFLMSNSDVPLVNDAFTHPLLNKKIVNCKRSINSKNPAAHTNEVLIWNYEIE